MLKRIVTVSALSFLVIFSAACASKAAKQDPAPSPAAAAPAASPAAAPSPAVEQAEVPATRQGSFVDGEHPTAGMVTLVNEGGQYYLEFAGDFKTDPGPDLFVILHEDADVIGSTAPPAHAIAEGSYVNIAPLEATTGAQRYAIPEAVDVSQYRSVAIWCRRFNATFGAATLQ